MNQIFRSTYAKFRRLFIKFLLFHKSLYELKSIALKACIEPRTYMLSLNFYYNFYGFETPIDVMGRRRHLGSEECPSPGVMGFPFGKVNGIRLWVRVTACRVSVKQNLKLVNFFASFLRFTSFNNFEYIFYLLRE